MGMYGNQSYRSLTTRYPAIDVTLFSKNDLAKPGAEFTLGWFGSGTIAYGGVTFNIGDLYEGERRDQLYVRYLYAQVGYGERAYWDCPNCHRRCGKIYRVQNGFGCLKCLKLIYPTQRMNAWERWEHKTDQIEALFSAPDYGDTFIRPKGMRKVRYERIKRQYQQMVNGQRPDSLATLRDGHR